MNFPCSETSILPSLKARSEVRMYKLSPANKFLVLFTGSITLDIFARLLHIQYMKLPPYPQLEDVVFRPTKANQETGIWIKVNHCIVTFYCHI